MARVTVNWTKRYVVSRRLSGLVALLYHVQADLYAVHKMETQGLTPGEAEYIKKRLDDLSRINTELTQINVRIRESVNKKGGIFRGN